MHKMGNQRQLLKDNIEKELVLKIEESKDILNQLNKSLEISKQNAFSTKEEIRVSTDLIKETLIKRKRELIREVENLHHAQARVLHDAIKSTYITMGKLQSMLVNLDSFDQSQLINLQIPAIDGSCTEQPQISATLDCDNIRKELKQWGSITDELGFSPEDFSIEIPTFNYESCCRKKAETTAQVPERPVLEENKENQVLPKVMEPTAPKKSNLSPWSTWEIEIENWLRRSNDKTCFKENKDNTFVPPNDTEDMEFIVLQENDCASSPLDNNTTASDDNSSIMCIEKETFSTPITNDLSMWLKPKKSKMTQPQSVPIVQKDKAASSPLSGTVTLIQTENILKSLSLDNGDKKRTIAVSKRLDYPCLHLSPDTWIRKRKPKSMSSMNSNKSISSINEKLKLIPPAYALPNPFWLKKYQKR